MRDYDIVILGATGYTGRLAAEYVTQTTPTNLRWAIAGRSPSKLQDLVQHLSDLGIDRPPPHIEICSLVLTSLEALTAKTKILLNTVGPYHLYSSPVVEACVKAGTHYLDVTGESPWILDMIHRHNQLAQKNKVIVIPSVGLESAPPDLLAWALVQQIARKFGCTTKEVVASLHELKAMPSGGSLATVFSILDTYSLAQVTHATSGKWSSSPVKGASDPTSWIGKILGVQSFPFLGIVTTSLLNAGPNIAVVQRSWGLHQGTRPYGPNFSYREYVTVRNRLLGLTIHALGGLAMAIIVLVPPLRWLLRRLISYGPGQGPTKESSQRDRVVYRALAIADSPERQCATGTFSYEGSIYYLTGLLLVEAAMVLLQDPDGVQSGFITPAVLGQAYVDRIRAAGIGFHIE